MPLCYKNRKHNRYEKRFNRQIAEHLDETEKLFNDYLRITFVSYLRTNVKQIICHKKLLISGTTPA